MTHNEFNQLRTSIKALTPDEMRQLRHELDSELALSAAVAGSPALTEDEDRKSVV
jgi:hypothetical protein